MGVWLAASFAGGARVKDDVGWWLRVTIREKWREKAENEAKYESTLENRLSLFLIKKITFKVLSCRDFLKRLSLVKYDL